MDFSKQLEANRRALIEDIFRRVETALRPFVDSLDVLLSGLAQGRSPADWRNRWHDFLADQAALGYCVEPKSARELEDWIEAWAAVCGLLPSTIEENNARADLGERGRPGFSLQSSGPREESSGQALEAASPFSWPVSKLELPLNRVPRPGR